MVKQDKSWRTIWPILHKGCNGALKEALYLHVDLTKKNCNFTFAETLGMGRGSRTSWKGRWNCVNHLRFL
jgi:hypothetical protein